MAARAAGEPFEQWVRGQLNAAAPAVDLNPLWARKLSERTRTCLIGAGFKSRAQVAKALSQGFDFLAIPNAGRRTIEEIEQWLK